MMIVCHKTFPKIHILVLSNLSIRSQELMERGGGERERETQTQTQTQKIYCLQVLKTSNNTAGTHSL